MGDVVNLPYTIGRGGRDGKIENNVGIICQGIRMANHIYRQSALLDIKAKEGMKKKVIGIYQKHILLRVISKPTWIW